MLNSQTPQENHYKYWYYKWRLNNNFVKVGDCQGCSEPAFRRVPFHMPYLKSAKETETNGANIGETLNGLTHNLEDHDHYLFNHDSRIETLEQENVSLKKKNQELEKRIESLEKKQK